MRTVKWHILDHVTENIVRNGGMFLCNAGLHEDSHTIFKNFHAKMSKRRKYVMDDSEATVGGRLRDVLCTTTREKPKHNELEEPKKELSSFARQKDCK